MAFIAVTELSGTINERKLSGLMPILDAVEKSSRVRGLLIHMNSSGGEANASEILFRKVRAIREKKPVISYVSGMCASGAYWVASASNRIYSMETSLVGSIGVISITPNVSKFLEKIGIDVQVIKAGKYKDLLNPFSEATEEGKQKMLHIIDSAYQSFWKSVSAERKIPGDQRDAIATGEVFTSEDAVKLGLVDSIGGYNEALSEIRKISGIKKTRFIAPRKTFVSRFIGMAVKDAVLETLDASPGYWISLQ